MIILRKLWNLFYLRLSLVALFLATSLFLVQKPVTLTGVLHQTIWGEDSVRIKYINAPQLFEWLQNNELIRLIDTRSPEEYNFMHIPGSHLWTDTLFYKIIKDYSGNPKIKVVLYCSAGCDLSHQVAGELNEILDMEICILQGGIDEWVNSGYEVKELL